MLPIRCLVAFGMGLAPLLGQLNVSVIRGTATDPTGAAVPNAEITLVNVATNLRRVVLSSASGDFEIPDLLRGTYKLTANAPGFKTFVAEDIVLETNQIRRINVVFEVGMVTSEVTVTAGAAVISTDTSKIQAGFGLKTFTDAPLIGDGRNPGLLLSVLPHVQTAGSIYSVQMAGQSGLQIQQGMDGFTTDGIVNQTSNFHDMEELVAVPVNNSAEFARVGYYNMVSKSGGNAFHGQLYYWHRNSAFDARNFFATQKPVAKSHTMHAHVTGPIIKDKLFFYAAWSAQRWPGGSSYLRDVPTELMRQGDFSQLLAATRPIVIKDPLTAQPFVGNVIPQSRLSQVSLKAQELYIPRPNAGGPGALASNYFFIWPWPEDLRSLNYYTQRIDYQISVKNRLYGRLMQNWADYVLSAALPALGWTRLRRGNHLVVENTHVFSPHLVHTARFGFYQAIVDDGITVDNFSPQRGDEVVKLLGIQGVNPRGLSAMGFPRMDIAGYPILRIQPGGRVGDLREWGFAQSLTWSKGRHVLKAGAELKPKSDFSGAVPEGTYGVFNFNGSLSGYGYADFLLGLPYTSTRLDPLTNRTRTDMEIGVYLQDTLKVTSRLNFDFGLRWDRFGPADYRDGLIYNWDPKTGAVVVPRGALSRVSGLYPKTIAVIEGDARERPSGRKFAPRIGVAYRPFGEKTVLRGGYGIFNQYLGAFVRAQGGGPYQLSETFINAVQGGQPLFGFPNPFPPGVGTVPSQSVAGYPGETDNGRIHQFNFSAERQLADIGFRLSYVGSRSRGLNYAKSINKPEPSLIPFSQARRPWPQFIGTTYVYEDGAANYNALTFQVQRKMGQLTFDYHWTWASNYNNMVNLENPYAPLVFARDRFTSRHRLVLNTIWQIPVGRGRRFLSNAPGPVDHVLGGWELYWIAFLEGGEFISPSFSGADPSNTNTVGGLPDRICNGNLPRGERRVERWFDASCFAVPAAGLFGNSGANVLEGPGRHEHDVTVSKRFRVKEKATLSCAMAVTNLFNRANFNNPSTNISVPGSVGRISSTKGYAPNRQMVMRLQLQF